MRVAAECRAWLEAQGFTPWEAEGFTCNASDWFISADGWVMVADPLVACPWQSVAELQATVERCRSLKSPETDEPIAHTLERLVQGDWRPCVTTGTPEAP